MNRTNHNWHLMVKQLNASCDWHGSHQIIDLLNKRLNSHHFSMQFVQSVEASGTQGSAKFNHEIIKFVCEEHKL
jgi:hypothetical protein